MMPNPNGEIALVTGGTSEVGLAAANALAAIPGGRFRWPEEVTKAVVFIASDDSSYITATALFADGAFEQI